MLQENRIHFTCNIELRNCTVADERHTLQGYLKIMLHVGTNLGIIVGNWF